MNPRDAVADDPRLNWIEKDDEDSDEEDEDYVAEKDDAGSPTDDSKEEGSDDSTEEPTKEPKKKEPVAPEPAVKKKKRDEEEDDGKKKKRKKDPNAPKRSLSSFMFFSQAERESLKKTNPEMSFKDFGRVLGDRWKKMTDEEKEPYEASAQRDRNRYKAEMAEYRSGRGASAATGEQSDDENSE